MIKKNISSLFVIGLVLALYGSSIGIDITGACDETNNQDGSRIRVLESSEMMQIYQVDNIIISVMTNEKELNYSMTVENVLTQQYENYYYVITQTNEGYSTDLIVNGELLGSYTMKDHPFESNAPVDKSHENGVIAGSIFNLIPMYIDDGSGTGGGGGGSATHYWWDGVYFIQKFGTTIKYSHPDCNYYSIATWTTTTLVGNNLKHTHFSTGDTSIIGGAGPVVAGVLIAGIIGGWPGALLGGVIGFLFTEWTTSAISDETGCAWLWEHEDWEWKFICIGLPGTVAGFAYMPKYLRIAEQTMWDDGGIGNPY
jgi:hypothetical protein